MNGAFRIVLLMTTTFCCQVASQAQYVIKGKVIDSLGSIPLANVSIVVYEANVSVLCEEDGSFVLRLPSLPVKAEVRLLGYKTQIIDLTNTKPLLISLEEETVLLNPIEISGENTIHVAGTDQRSIWDYTWVDNKLLLCDYGLHLSDARLILMNEYFDTLDIKKCPSKPDRLYTDCMGFAHMQGADSTWQIETENERLAWLSGESNYLVENILLACKASNSNYLYFEIPQGKGMFDDDELASFKFETNNDVIYYFYADRLKSEMYYLTSITDHQAQKLKQEEKSYGVGPGGKRVAESAASKAASKAFFYKQMLKEIYAPVFLKNDSVFILDYVNNHIAVFDSTSELVRADTLKHHARYDFKRQCYQDIVTEEVYVEYEDRQTTFLCRLDLTSGNINQCDRLPYPFPYHLMIRDGHAYYIHRSEKDHSDRHLVKVRLDGSKD